MSSIPTTQSAYVINGAKGEVKSVAVPKLASGQVLIKNEAVAINPTDWKHVDFQLGVDGAIVGCDVAGTVVAVGEDVKGVKVGDQLFGLVSGASAITPENGGFAEYSAIYADRSLKVGNKLEHAKGDSLPAGPVTTWEGAASLPVGLITSLIGFVHWAKLPIHHESKFNDQYFLVWGGASSLGQLVIQFAKKVGFKVIATASSHNFDLLKELGAEAVFDYHDKDVLEQISKHAGDDITYAYDTITTPPTTLNVYSVLSKTRESVLLTSLNFDEKTIKEVNPKVKAIDFPLAYLAIDKKKKFGATGFEISSPAGLFEDTVKGVSEVNEGYAKDPAYLRHIPVKIVRGGLSALDEALDIVRQGKNSGVKIVVPL
ncbi:hypothetical protein AWJ20_2698 [Sugiyamaella lignohabitans]|uniref:Enoyl reductase (ER) domain-containing protein n=1 Tax=Sugiyamaella lignohabitans TaxID=796027 RepID=A0A167FBN3_9ASCO|nr:uncharacterized protein AWJ20_2698 [Sugiyamaella lignohabitans]ANB15078.1 hypothetical protein AWJ20_2698 [Sugiyamaella lignohabitans]